MRQAKSFRFSTQVTAILSALEDRLHLSKTAIIEDALLSYSKRFSVQQPLLKHVGVLNEKDAHEMLRHISSHKHSKKLRTL